MCAYMWHIWFEVVTCWRTYLANSSLGTADLHGVYKAVKCTDNHN